MLVSIIIVVYNGIAYLEKCLGSVWREINRAESEIIIIDNCSTDGSADFIQDRYPDVILIRNETNRGFAPACNQGAKQAQGQYLVFLNQDTEVLPGWLSGLLEPLEQDKSVGLTTSKLLLMSRRDKINSCGQDIHYTGLNFSRGFLDDANQFARSEVVGAVCGASFAIRKDVWEELGGFDEDFFMYFEETDLSWRAQLAGYQCLYVPASVAYHDYHHSRPHFSRLYYSKRNRYILLLKNWRLPTLFLLLPGIILAEIVDWGYTALMGPYALRAKISAYRWILTHLPKVRKVHREVQEKRKVPDRVILRGRTHRLNPKEVTGGTFGRILIAACNLLFLMNYWVARLFCQIIGL